MRMCLSSKLLSFSTTFQYSIGDADKRGDGHSRVVGIAFQYSIGDASSGGGLVGRCEEVAFNTPLEMPWSLSR